MKRNPFGALLDKTTPPEGLLLLTLSVIIGGSTGLAAVAFIHLIAIIQNRSYTTVHFLFPHLGIWSYALVPIGGALLAGPVIAWFAREAKGHGVPEVMQALVMSGGRIRPRVAIAKIVASALCIGTGGSAGREGPIVQVGATLGSSVGQILHLSDDRIKNLVACGAAAGIAATFNAPIAGVAFAIEVLMCELKVRAFGNVVIAAVSAAVVSQMYLGDRPAFTVPSYTMESPLTIFFYLLLGLVAALVGVAFIRMLSWFEDVFDNWNFPLLWKPAVGALFLGLLGVFYINFTNTSFSNPTEFQLGMPLIENIPHVYGPGFTFIEEVLHGGTDFWILALLVLLKPLATSLTLGSGNSGGVFAPSLFIGAMLGGAMGELFFAWQPELAGPPGAYALVGMAAVFAACARAPLTAMLIVFEMSNDYALILPLMLTAVTATYLAQYLHPESIYTVKLVKRGIRFDQGRDKDIMQGVQVREVMLRSPLTIYKNQSLAELYQRFQETNLLGFPVLDENDELWGIVTLQDMERALSAEAVNLRTLKVEDLATVDPLTVFSDEPIYTAIQKMAPRDLARLPVVSRKSKNKLLGLISRSDILRAYDVGIVRKQRGQLLEEQTTLRREQYNDFTEFRLKAGAYAVGKNIKELHLPGSINVVSLDREGVLHIPHGTTSFAAGDIVTLFGRKNLLKSSEKLFLSGKK
ncbi:chloride channel protein EriC [Desulfocapsa sulfexigens DSM 10523]|uniref:Chloride channel protein EriC n=1 Tax=Desulfocapsa sulfexigens (strain DSM 10523 / SB164P1) TaxID=1167006 RepID=M1PLC9_DESSD|nr:chloride channel protein [Desulfocapsa sulfexigens]AGF77281.1 chloride channel protein EriC [Desulfocapsa sulfexigens DSM 10523]